MILTAEEVGTNRMVATLQLRAQKLDNKDFFGKSDPFLVIYRINDDKRFILFSRRRRRRTVVVVVLSSSSWSSSSSTVGRRISFSRTLAYRSEVIKNNLNPMWKPSQISLRQLCNGDYERFLVLLFW